MSNHNTEDQLMTFEKTAKTQLFFLKNRLDDNIEFAVGAEEREAMDAGTTVDLIKLNTRWKRALQNELDKFMAEGYGKH
jgi:hypothetical protein|tara:strand:- start:253 stop:489 length:237 start_codon:yes stop_codon:yes gene_type:complete